MFCLNRLNSFEIEFNIICRWVADFCWKKKTEKVIDMELLSVTFLPFFSLFFFFFLCFWGFQKATDGVFVRFFSSFWKLWIENKRSSASLFGNKILFIKKTIYTNDTIRHFWKASSQKLRTRLHRFLVNFDNRKSDAVRRFLPILVVNTEYW